VATGIGIVGVTRHFTRDPARVQSSDFTNAIPERRRRASGQPELCGTDTLVCAVFIASGPPSIAPIASTLSTFVRRRSDHHLALFG
jgi:hypothetical protein